MNRLAKRVKRAITLLSVITLAGCGHEYNDNPYYEELYKQRKGAAVDTLTIDHFFCTECLDGNIIQGRLSIPSDLKNLNGFPHDGEIVLAGKFPFEYLDMQSHSYRPELMFRIRGMVISDSLTPAGYAPVFYVTDWTKFQYSMEAWNEKFEQYYKNRKKMVGDLLDNFRFEGESLQFLTNLLGNPDVMENNEASYKIEEEYLTDIDPIYLKSLVFKFDKDSIIRGHDFRVYKKK